MDKTDKQTQMAFLFEEGGIADDGMNVDPVSGNEVPPGSLAKEVRDDVPAQLSEGEYVVPADVTRYYGVKFFEDLRDQAKQGMMEMEAAGRIGGEPVAQTMANQTGGELTPEEMAAIQQVTGMAMGGMAKQLDPPAPAVGNTGQYNQGGQVLYAAPGTDVSTGQSSTIDPYTSQFTQGQASMFSPGFLIDQTLGTTGTPKPLASNIVTLYSPTGEMRTFNLAITSQKAEHDKLIASGWSTEPGQVTTETTVGEEERGGRDGGPQDGPTGTTSGANGTGPSVGDVVSFGLGLTGPGLAAQAIDGLAGLLGLDPPDILGRIADAIDGKKGEDDDDDETTNIFGLIGKALGISKDKDTPSAPPGRPGSDTGEDSGPASVSNNSVGTGTTAGPTAGSAQDPTISGFESNDPRGGGSDVGTDTGTHGGGSSGGGTGPSGVSGTSDGEAGQGTDNSGAGDQGMGSGWGGMKDGGLVSRPRKKKKK